MNPSPSPDRLAAIHRAAFGAAGWDAAALERLAAMSGAFVLAEDEGFILCRLAGDEAEIITLAVTPAARRRGLGGRLLDQAVVRVAADGARTLFIEVACDNIAALGLYDSRGFSRTGRRSAYYARADGSRTDALILALNLDQRLF